MKALVVGGTSGIGLELARLLKSNHETVIITGRTDPKEEGMRFVPITIGPHQNFTARMIWLIQDYSFDTVIYNPGFYQESRISSLTDEQILDMAYVGFLGAAMLMQRILKQQENLPYFAAVTSTSQLRPRELEPIYTAVKAGLGMLANSLSLDKRIGRTLVAAPAATKTNFWKDTGKDTSEMLDASWVADQIFDCLFHKKPYRYMHALILRDPPRVQIEETR
jgi:NAD(P)-dependent dehydrogenase (short-subunit alcohol dehydrogenase family)